LVAFYPLYLAERWIRNRDFTYCALRFNCDFADHLYVHDWLYGNGKYSIVWYEPWPTVLCFFAISLTFALALWKKSSCKPWVAAILGLVCGFTSISAYFSQQTLKDEEWNGLTVKERHGGGPVLELKMKSATGGSLFATRSGTSQGGGGGIEGSGADDYWLEDQVIAIRTNSFLMMFRLKRPGKAGERVLIVFPFDTVTETNWNGWQIQGRFL
jgi:hypothetical protein